jgi:ribonuclease VapC
VNRFVLDASALLAYILGEPGLEVVEDALSAGAVMSSVNVAETTSRLVDYGFGTGRISQTLERADFETVPLDYTTALRAGLLRGTARSAGLSIGDRCCIALAQTVGLPAVTADRAWLQLDLGIRVELCR